MTYLDGLGSSPALSSYSQIALQELKEKAVARLHVVVPVDERQAFVPTCDPQTHFQLGSFAIPRGPQESPLQTFNFQAPTTQSRHSSGQNIRPRTCSNQPFRSNGPHRLVRLGSSCRGRWSRGVYGEFLKALQEGRWVLLDEMDLAPQAVLEGLNAVLDHRGAVYIPELGRTSVKHPTFRIFAAQNRLPIHVCIRWSTFATFTFTDSAMKKIVDMLSLYSIASFALL
ncbi:AAA ATPase midasin [Stygiomarasmius scandens]|uniref:AAA ATPase midasin n=1 Tax=Marasmiellus scandens TaxID=2682957 RepID=A0ABR1IP22_9AGAR